MDFLDDAKALLNVVRKFVNSPTRQTLAELRQQLPNLVQALEPPRPSAADAERVRTRSTGVAAVDRLSDKDLGLARQLSDRLHINELLAARLVATQARTSVQTLVFVCAHAADSSARLRPSLVTCCIRMRSGCLLQTTFTKRCVAVRVCGTNRAR